MVRLDEGETSGDGSVPTAGGYGNWFWKFQYSSCSVSIAEWVVSRNVCLVMVESGFLDRVIG